MDELDGLRSACEKGNHHSVLDHIERGVVPDAECLRLAIRARGYGMECLEACLRGLKKTGVPAGGFEDGKIPPLHLAARERGAAGLDFDRYVEPLVDAGADPREKWRGLDAADEAQNRGHASTASWLREISLALNDEDAVREATGG